MTLALLAKLGGKSGWHPRRFAAVGGIAGRAGRAWRPAAASVIAVPRSLWMAFANPAAIATGGAGRHQRLRPDEGSDKIRGAAGGAKDRRPALTTSNATPRGVGDDQPGIDRAGYGFIPARERIFLRGRPRSLVSKGITAKIRRHQSPGLGMVRHLILPGVFKKQSGVSNEPDG
jgi:hypothetical protein